MERSIPHIRNIFSNSSRKKSTSDTQDLCQYEKSPRGKRKTKEPPVDYYDKLDRSSGSPKKNGFDPGKENLKSSEESRKGSNRNGNYNTYTSKTLTERDMRHLERHLSMKKTIRKQISRNLAQAFLDNPNIFEPGDNRPDNHKNDHTLPPLADKMEKHEQNVLDLLKISIEDRDSGHSSPTHENLEDPDYEEEELEAVRTWRSSASSKHRDSDTKVLMEEKSKHHNQESEKKSIWKMFSSRSKGKR